ncbi:Di-copper centre-containing protein [Rhypophila sp. PSN 637]
MTKISRVFALAAALACLAEVALASPVVEGKGKGHSPKKCKKPAKRRAWHTLGNKDKKAYIDAQLCVMAKPGNPALPGVRTLFDEMVSIHQLQTLTIHSTGTFLPWHRWYLDLHERNLRDCGFKGGIPYWDEYHEAALPLVASSSVFDPITGFGSEGTIGPEYCLTDGPFANYTNAIGPNWNITDGCIGRHHVFNPLRDASFVDALILPNATDVRAQTDYCLSLTTWAEASTCIYLTPHVAGHIGMGSTRGDPFTSPTEPLFYLHHAYIDKLWADWQAQNPAARTYAIGGRNTQDPAVGFLELPGDMAFEEEFVFQSEPTPEQAALVPAGDEGDNGPNVTLNHEFTAYGRIPLARARQVMDTKGGYLCYEYV